MMQSSTGTNGSGGTSQSSTRKRRPPGTSGSSRSAIRVVRQRNHDELRRQAEDPFLARKLLLRAALFDSLREAERIL